MKKKELNAIELAFRVNLADEKFKLAKLKTGTCNKRFHGPGYQLLDRQGRVLWSCSGISRHKALREAIRFKLLYERAEARRLKRDLERKKAMKLKQRLEAASATPASPASPASPAKPTRFLWKPPGPM